MRRAEAFQFLASWIGGRVQTAPVTEQIKVYEALGTVLPTQAERDKATEIAVTLSEVAKLQLDFSRELFTGLSKVQTGDGRDS